jgi:hypothetical protein
MVKHIRIRNKIYILLGEGRMNTKQINEWVNDNTKNGISPNALVNVLSKNPDLFKNVGEEKVGGFTGPYTVRVWDRV